MASTTTTTTTPKGGATSPPGQTTTSTSTTTSTTLPEVLVARETGNIDGQSADRPLLFSLIDDTALTNVKVGDIVETAGGTKSLAPQGLPIGTITAVRQRLGSRTPIVEVEPNASLTQLNFVSRGALRSEPGRDLSRALAAVCPFHPTDPGRPGVAGDPADGLRHVSARGRRRAGRAGAWLPVPAPVPGPSVAPSPASPLGMMYDLGVGTPLGLTALAYGLAGLTSGYVMSITPTRSGGWRRSSWRSVRRSARLAIPVVKFLTGQEGWLDDRLFLVIPGGHRGGNVAQPVDGSTRSMVCWSEAPHVESDSRMKTDVRTNQARSIAAARRQQWCHGDRKAHDRVSVSWRWCRCCSARRRRHAACGSWAR